MKFTCTTNSHLTSVTCDIMEPFQVTLSSTAKHMAIIHLSFVFIQWLVIGWLHNVLTRSVSLTIITDRFCLTNIFWDQNNQSMIKKFLVVFNGVIRSYILQVKEEQTNFKPSNLIWKHNQLVVVCQGCIRGWVWYLIVILKLNFCLKAKLYSIASWKFTTMMEQLC